MSKQRPWQTFPATYRAEVMAHLAGWIQAGESGSVIGLAGCGRSNLLNFLCHRPAVLPTYLPDKADPVALILVDLSHLPANDPATLYLVILREFYWLRERFPPPIQEAVVTLFEQFQATENAFLAQTALHELLFAFQAEAIQVVLILNHFDRFAEQATRQTLDTLRGLRDSFKDTVCFIAGMVHEAVYLPDPELLGDMLHTLLNRHICWVGPMSEADARHVIAQSTHTAPTPPTEAEIKHIIKLTGGFPALLQAAGFWWLEQRERPPLKTWAAHLLEKHNIRYWLERLWQGLTQEEQLALAAVWAGQQQVSRAKNKARKADDIHKQVEKEHGPILRRLAEKGVCHHKKKGWHLLGELLERYIEQVGPSGKGRIWIDGVTRNIMQGETSLSPLPPQEDTLLRFFIEHPYKRHTYTTLIEVVWADEIIEGDDGRNYVARGKEDLQPLVLKVRKKIEISSSEPRYIINWKGKPEGGYQFYPEGRPEEL